MPVFLQTRREFLKASAAAAVAGGRAFPAIAARDPARIALVVGNNAYPFAPLGNAINDAKAVSDLLVRAGFSVTLRTDVTRDAFRQSASAFGEAARKSEAKLVFFYFAGHGSQMAWRNYFVPIDANVTSASELPAQCFELGTLLDDLSQTKDKVLVIVLDACRDNPFGMTYQPAQKGLSQFDAPVGSLLAFSTAPGSVASDGLGANGLYTENLVKELSTKGARLEDSLKRVRLSVRMASHGAQIPWESTSLESDVFLFPSGDKLSEAQLEEQLQHELDTWNRTKGSKQPEDWVTYLREYPSGRFTEVAQERLSYLLTRLEASTPTKVPVVASSGAASLAPSPLPVIPTTAIVFPAVVATESPTLSTSVASTATIISPLPPLGSAAPAPAITNLASAAAQAPAVTPIAPLASKQAQSLAANSQADLEIRAGLPAPVLMRPLENPLSAGTYPLNRRFSVGDEGVYTVSDTGFAENRRTLAFHVTRVDEDADRVEIDSGTYVWDSMGNPLKYEDRIYDPRVQLVPVELQLGKKWTTTFRLKEHKGWWESYYDYKVVSRERVKVPAGEFEAFKLEGDGWNKTTSTRLMVRLWVVPGLNFDLKMLWIRYPRSGPDIGELHELVSCRQRRWSQA